MSVNRDINEAAAPWVKEFLRAIELMREKGYSDADIDAMLTLVEREDFARDNPDLTAVVMGKLRKAAFGSPKS
jgi:hypothetical protein